MNDQPENHEEKEKIKSSAAANKRSFVEGQYIFRQGETGDLAFVVLAGEVEIVHTVGHDIVPIGTVSKGGMFGEMALIDNKTRMASARAKTASVDTLVISREMFHKKMASADPFHKALFDILASHIRSLSDQLVNAGARAS